MSGLVGDTKSIMTKGDRAPKAQVLGWGHRRSTATKIEFPAGRAMTGLGHDLYMSRVPYPQQAASS